MFAGVEDLPGFPLRDVGGVSARLISIGARDFRSAGRYVKALPYGRNSDRSDPRLVLGEGRGTCSTKHALLAQVAVEQGFDVRLVIGIYEMTGRNTPGVGAVLKRHGLSVLPEAHCYLSYRGQRIDLTRALEGPAEPIKRFLYEEEISPAQIGDYKLELHRRWLGDWASRSSSARGLDPDLLWKIREECIAALAE